MTTDDLKMLLFQLKRRQPNSEVCIDMPSGDTADGHRVERSKFFVAPAELIALVEEVLRHREGVVS